MSAIVFGASGFIGSHVTEQLIHMGQVVTAVVRTPNQFLQHIGAKQIVLDFSAPAALASALAAHSVLYCCLANPRRHLAMEDLRAVEVELTRQVIAAAAQAGLQRVVLLSTVMVYGFSRSMRAIDENDVPAPDYPFSRVALEREQVAQTIAARTGIELVIARPSMVIGRRDRQLRALINVAQKGIFPLFGGEDCPFSCMDARDLGRAMGQLGSLAQAAGQTYLLKGFDTSWLEIKASLACITGKPSCLLRLPKPLAMEWGHLLEVLLPYGWEPSLSRFAVDVMTTPTLLDDRKLCALDFHARYGLDDALRDCLHRS